MDNAQLEAAAEAAWRWDDESIPDAAHLRYWAQEDEGVKDWYRSIVGVAFAAAEAAAVPVQSPENQDAR